MRRRLKSLDFLRGIAVVLVLFRHVPYIDELPINEYFIRILGYLQAGGWIGVDLFFVLSGYLVSSLIFNEYQTHSTFNVNRFLIRRGLKIYPSFYVFLLITTLIQIVFNRPIEISNLISELLYVQNYFGHLFPHTWSLAIEEHFYIILSAISFYFLSTNKNKFKTILTILIITPTILRYINFHNNIYSFDTHFSPTHLRIDALSIGVLIAWFKFFEPDYYKRLLNIANNKLVLLLALALLVPNFILPISSEYINVIGLAINSVGGVFILLFILSNEQLSFPNSICTIGKYSYSIYLWHILFMYWPEILLNQIFHFNISEGLLTLIYFTLGIFCGILSARLIEYPVLIVRDKFFPSLSH